MLVKQWDT